jgi:hypothetical protein
VNLGGRGLALGTITYGGSATADAIPDVYTDVG